MGLFTSRERWSRELVGVVNGWAQAHRFRVGSGRSILGTGDRALLQRVNNSAVGISRGEMKGFGERKVGAKRTRIDDDQLRLLRTPMQAARLYTTGRESYANLEDAGPGQTQAEPGKIAGKKAPLADRVRPTDLENFYGHENFVGKDSILRKLLDSGKVPSMILWGPPGTGKTTLARIISKKVSMKMFELSAAKNSLSDVREAENNAINHLKLTGKQCIIFIDEIHRFTKAQQDHLLEPVESGKFVLICATTENPSFRLNNALISRCSVIVLEQISQENVKAILNRAAHLEFPELEVVDESIDMIASMGNGDARASLNILESALLTCGGKLSSEDVKQAFNKSLLYYDRNCEEHYNLISALHKSIRGGDVDASLYYLWRMLDGGEDVLYICRRLVRLASEDIGIADSNALNIAVSTYHACEFLGMPECGCSLSHCVVYLTNAPKSVAVYKAETLIRNFIKSNVPYPVPMHIRNAPTSLMKKLGYGDGYLYPPSHPGGLPSSYSYLPDEMRSKRFFGVFEEAVSQNSDQFENEKCKVLPKEELCVKKEQ